MAQAQTTNHIGEIERESSKAAPSNVVRLRNFQSVAKPNSAPAQTKSAASSPSDQLSSQERNAFREIARALGAKIEADDLSSAPPQMQEDPAVPKAEASPPPSITSDETKREEVDKSLAKIRDFIEITLADAETHSPKDPIPPQTSAKLEEMSPSLPSVVQEEPVAQAKDQTEDPLSLEALSLIHI